MPDPARLPLTAYQRDIWFSDTLVPHSPQYSIVLRERFSGDLDLDLLTAAVRHVLAHNDALRIRCGSTDGLPYQWLEPEDPQLAVLDLRAEADPEAACLAWAEDSRSRRLPILGGRLYRAALLRASDTVVHFQIVMHHLISDGWTLNEFRKQVLLRYAELTRGEERPSGPAAPSFTDFIDGDSRYRASEAYARDRRYVLDTLSGAEPRLFARKDSGAPRRGLRTSFTVEGETVDRILAGGNSPFSAVVAAFGICLATLHEADEAVIGVPLLNRHSDEELRAHGLFTNVLPLRVRTDGNPSMSELAKQVRDSTRGLQEHQRIPLADVLRERSTTGAEQLFDVTISNLRFPAPPSAPGLSVKADMLLELLETNALAVTLHAYEGVGELRIDLVYAEDVFDEHLPVAVLVEAVRELLRQSADQPDSPAGPPPGLATARTVPAASAGPAAAVPAESGDGRPRTELEAELAAIWADVLEVPSVGIHDNYFVLGGDSITMLRIRAGGERRGIHFSLTDLIKGPTVAQLATRAVLDAGGTHTATAVTPFELVSAVDRGRLTALADAFPLTRVQLGLLYHSRRHENSAVYNDVFQYSVGTAWHEKEFRTAFAGLVERHPVLRSSLDLASYSQPLQLVHHQVPDALDVVDLRALPGDEAAAAIRAHIEERRFVRYEFAQAPLHLFRAHVLADSVELVFSFHHALLDGGSVANLITELLQDYAHGIGADIPAVPDGDLPSPADHVREELLALDSADSRAYWRQALSGVTLPQLDGFRLAEAPGPTELVVHDTELPGAVQAAARRFAQEHELPLKSVLFAAYCLTMSSRFSTRDFVTGLVTHGRPELPGAERIAGLFLNTMPVRADLSYLTWLETARALFAQEQESHPHRRYPLSAIQNDEGAEFVLESAFNYVHFHQLAAVLSLPEVRLLDFRTWEETNFKILVNAYVDPLDESIRLRADFDGAVFTPAQAELFTDTYVQVLRRMTERPGETVDFGFLAPEPAALTPVTGEPRDVVTLFTEQAARTPDAVAVAFDGGRWTYRELARAADRVAGHLRAAGTTTGDRVAVALDRSPELIAVVLGIAKAGAAVVPLDTAYPAERLRMMLEQARPVRVVTDPGHAHLAGDPDILLPVGTVTGEDHPHGHDPAPVTVSPQDIAYVLFTSGSTGVPKGVRMPHRSLANLIAWQNGAPSAAPGGTTLQFAPLSFDVSFQEIFSTLTSGGVLQLVSEAQRRDARALLDLLDTARVERVFLPYVALQQLAETSNALGRTPAHLRVVVSSGEQLRVTEEIRRLCAALPGVVLENQYGPTESHVVTRFTMTGPASAFPALPPIGSPIAGCAVHVLDERLRPAPVGVRGEIYLDGACLADGYLGGPEQTAERFVPHPFTGQGRLYRTGDLGRVLPGGDILFLGRADTQLKVRGFRVEPAEVELAITGRPDLFPGIREAAVVARHREGTDSFLAAFLVADATGTAAADLEKIRAGLRRTLPEHMVPSHLQWVPDLPLTPSGKRDDAALRRLPLHTDAPDESAAPRDEYERTLAEILAELLHLPAVGVHGDFFDLGGTSLTAMRLVVLIKQRYGVDIPMSRFVTTPTVSGLAELLRSGEALSTFDPLVPFRAEGTRPPLFFVHPAGGNVLCFAQLAKHLPADQPFYGLQAPGTELGSEPLRSVEELATSYLKAIRAVQPHGPYTLGGWSFGGFVALEMARQLHQVGERTANVFLLDTVALEPGKITSIDDDALLTWFFWELLFLELGGESPEAHIPRHLDDLSEKFEFIAQRGVDLGVLPPGSSAAIVRRLFKVYAANWQSALDYSGKRFDLDFTLMRATQPLPQVLLDMHTTAGTLHRDPRNGWGDRTTGELTVVEVPGDHLLIMEEPYVPVMAEKIMRMVDEASGGAR
ncbi:amino acid adenylation domain-containing protein [Streptomyces sp. HU2014]|uniref:non-ribosomal peptide synthetase n=1 Tax=Streptomyces sp. HU2014 TaxID=2939414 RepID=UPI00200DFA86|nr:non-ribosomal peptide synthetase [Streptomyces sp. HU2014]UQI45505.1 amino acid adenylation domain-containing protein [Streptomyces sp. HU2014]